MSRTSSLCPNRIRMTWELERRWVASVGRHPKEEEEEEGSLWSDNELLG